MKKKTGKGKEKCIVKRKGHCEVYDEEKVYGSVYAACYIIHYDARHCEKIAKKVAKKVSLVIHQKKKMSAHAISQIVHSELKKHSPKAAFMYRTHKDIS